MEKDTIAYKGHDGRTYNVSIHEDDKYWYIDFNTGLGEGMYPKADFTLEQAIDDQYHIFDEDYLPKA